VSAAEVYKLTCWSCLHTLELPAVDGTQACPNCQASLMVEWHAEREQFEQAGERQRA
jgi:hypothetical protein